MKQIVLLALLANVLFSCAQPTKQTAATAANQGETMPTLLPDTGWKDKVTKTNAEWKKILTAEQYYITFVQFGYQIQQWYRLAQLLCTLWGQEC
jgi:hypothetical protein